MKLPLLLIIFKKVIKGCSRNKRMGVSPTFFLNPSRPVPYHLKFEASDPVPYPFLPCIFHEPSTLCRIFFRAHPSLRLFPKGSFIIYEAGGPGAASIQKLSQMSRITLIRPLWWSMMMNVKEKVEKIFAPPPKSNAKK